MLLNKTYPDRFRKGMEERVRKRGINIVFDDFVDDTPEEGTYSSIKTRSGKTIKADLVVRLSFSFNNPDSKYSSYSSRRAALPLQLPLSSPSARTSSTSAASSK